MVESSSLVKSFAVLEALAADDQAMQLAAVSRRAAVSKPNSHRILQALIALGYVRQRDDRSYQLTAKLAQLTHAGRDIDMVREVEPLLRGLRDETGETVNFAVLDGEMMRYLAVYESPQPLRRVASPGEQDPFYATALGRSYVAFLEPARQAHLLSHVKIASRTDRTVTDLAEVRKILAQTRTDGYAVEHDQCDIGVTCIGAPVIVADEPVAAVSLSIPTARCDKPALRSRIKAVCTSAREASRLLSRQRERHEH